ncbi:hypothetical protein [Nocardia sp. NPDC003963]
MPLRFEPDVSVAKWFTDREEPWTQVSALGPSGFARYARLFHPPRSGSDADDPDPIDQREGDLDPQVLKRLVGILAEHTRSSGDCFFALWDGFGDIHGGGAFAVASTDPAGYVPVPPVPAAFPPEVLDGPRLRIPARDYLLFRGPLGEAGQWGAADLMPEWPRPINSPNLIWPADRNWFVATEIDLPWTGIGGSADLIATICADPLLDAEETELSADPPYRRDLPPV